MRPVVNWREYDQPYRSIWHGCVFPGEPMWNVVYVKAWGSPRNPNYDLYHAETLGL